MSKFDEMCSMHPSEIGQAIQPNDNIGEPGEISADSGHQTISVEISKEEDGSVKITSDVMCVKLHAPIIEALKVFFTKEQEINNGTVN